MEIINKHPVPLTLICGFLGSGKTTLIKRLINQTKKRIAIIQNEMTLEALGIEAPMIKNLMNSDVQGSYLELPSGCICCSMKTDLVRGIENLLQENPLIENVIIEASGIADVTELISNLWLDKEISETLILDTVVCVVDSQSTSKKLFSESLKSSSLYERSQMCIYDKLENININIKDEMERDDDDVIYHLLIRNIICANVVILNKCDVIKKEMNRNKESMIRFLNPYAEIFETSFCSIDTDILFDRSDFSGVSEYPSKKFDRMTNQMKSDVHMDSPIRHFFYILPPPLILDLVESWLGSVVWHETNYKKELGTGSGDMKNCILRVKGIFTVDQKTFSIQGVGDIFEVEEVIEQKGANGIRSKEDCGLKVLFIGFNRGIMSSKDSIEKSYYDHMSLT